MSIPSSNFQINSKTITVDKKTQTVRSITARTAMNNDRPTQQESKSGLDSLVQMAGDVLFGVGNPSVRPPSNEAIPETDFERQILEFRDMRVITGDIVGMAGKVSQISVNQREINFEPMLMERLFSQHSPWRLNLNPGIVKFDGNGEMTVGASTATSCGFSGINTISPGTLGFAFVLQTPDVLNGQSSFFIENTDTGFQATFRMDEPGSKCTVVILNHDQDFINNATIAAPTIALGVGDLAYSEAATDVPSQYYFSFVPSDKWVMRGSNVTINAYPILVSRDSVELVYAALTADVMDQLPNALALAFQNA